jgi:hypothetical protein
MRKRLIISMAVLGLAAIGCTKLDAWAGRVLNDVFVTHPFRHRIWQDVLTQNLGPHGTVDFARLIISPRRLNEYLSLLEIVSPENDPQAFPTRDDQAAYWINAHNAIALRLIISRFPAASAKQVPDLETSKRYKLGGVAYSLPEIRKKALSLNPSPAIACTMTNYTLGAPPLLPRAYEGQILKPLSRQAQQMTLADPHLIRFQRTGNSNVVTWLSAFFAQFEKIQPALLSNSFQSLNLGTKKVVFMPASPIFRQVSP